MTQDEFANGPATSGFLSQQVSDEPVFSLDRRSPTVGDLEEAWSLLSVRLMPYKLKLDLIAKAYPGTLNFMTWAKAKIAKV